MAIYDRQRVPKRIPKALEGKARFEAKEWWVVMAPTAHNARQVCLEWPSLVEMDVPNGRARIIDHGKKRT